MSTNKLLLLLLLLAPEAQSAAKLACVPADDLDARTKDCSDNHHYTKAGQNCLEKLEALIKSGRESKQSLLAAAKEAKKQVGAYRDDIYYPEDWDAPEELIGDPVDFFDSEKCYAEARDALKNAEEKIDRHIAEYQAGRTPKK